MEGLKARPDKENPGPRPLPGKSDVKTDTPERPPFYSPTNVPKRNRCRKGSQKGPPREAKVESKWCKVTSKRVLKYGLYPKGAPSGSDGLWRTPLEVIWDPKISFFHMTKTGISSCFFKYFWREKRRHGTQKKAGIPSCFPEFFLTLTVRRVSIRL